MTTSTVSAPSRPPRLRRKNRIVGMGERDAERRRRGAVAGRAAAGRAGCRRRARTRARCRPRGRRRRVSQPAAAAREVAVADQRVRARQSPHGAKGCSSAWPSQSAPRERGPRAGNPGSPCTPSAGGARRCAWSPPCGPSFGRGNDLPGRYRDSFERRLERSCPHANRLRPKVSGLPADGTRVREGSVADEQLPPLRCGAAAVRWRPYDARRLTAPRAARRGRAAAVSFAVVALAMALLLPFDARRWTRLLAARPDRQPGARLPRPPAPRRRLRRPDAARAGPDALPAAAGGRARVRRPRPGRRRADRHRCAVSSTPSASSPASPTPGTRSAPRLVVVAAGGPPAELDVLGGAAARAGSPSAAVDLLTADRPRVAGARHRPRRPAARDRRRLRDRRLPDARSASSSPWPAARRAGRLRAHPAAARAARRPGRRPRARASARPHDAARPAHRGARPARPARSTGSARPSAPSSTARR